MTTSSNDLADVFAAAVRNRALWRSTESASGEGSTFAATNELVTSLVGVIKLLDINTLIDAPCGDCNWINPVAGQLKAYYGIDVVPEVVNMAQSKVKHKHMRIVCDDLRTCHLPQHDAILVRDCFVHLSYKDAMACMANIRQAGIKYLLTTTFPHQQKNDDKPSDVTWRPLNMRMYPFSMSSPLLTVYERPKLLAYDYAAHAVPDSKLLKAIGVWKLT